MRYEHPSTASSRCGDTTTIRSSSAGATTPHSRISGAGASAMAGSIARGLDRSNRFRTPRSSVRFGTRLTLEWRAQNAPSATPSRSFGRSPARDREFFLPSSGRFGMRARSVGLQMGYNKNQVEPVRRWRIGSAQVAWRSAHPCSDAQPRPTRCGRRLQANGGSARATGPASAARPPTQIFRSQRLRRARAARATLAAPRRHPSATPHHRAARRSLRLPALSAFGASGSAPRRGW